ncbi:unnamed protein product [Euphydryas editha]|nr:unnamed protein product [Euphydryas editha]
MQRLLDLNPERLDKWKMAGNVNGKTAALLTEAAYGSHCKSGGEPSSDGPIKTLFSTDLQITFTSQVEGLRSLRLLAADVRGPNLVRSVLDVPGKEDAVPAESMPPFDSGAPRYVKNNVIPRDIKTPTVEEYVRHYARTMFARAVNSACTHLHGIAPLHERPLTGRPRTYVPRELLPSLPTGPNAGGNRDNQGDEEKAPTE